MIQAMIHGQRKPIWEDYTEELLLLVLVSVIKGYIGTGNTGTNQEGLKNDFWEYDPNTVTGGTWTQKANFAETARDCGTGFSIGTKGYIGLGYIGSDNNGDILMQDFWEYNPTTDAWTQKTDFGSKHKGPLKDVAIDETGRVSNEDLVVYPNPSSSTFSFSLKTTDEELVTIQIFDMMGRVVREYNSLSPDDVMTIGDNLDAGEYLLLW